MTSPKFYYSKHPFYLQSCVLNPKILEFESAIRRDDILFLSQNYKIITDELDVHELFLIACSCSKNLHIVEFLIKVFTIRTTYLNINNDNCLNIIIKYNNNFELFKYLAWLTIDGLYNFNNNYNVWFYYLLNRGIIEEVKYCIEVLKINIRKFSNSFRIVCLKDDLSIVVYLIENTDIHIDADYIHVHKLKMLLSLIKKNYTKFNDLIVAANRKMHYDEFHILMHMVNPLMLKNSYRKHFKINYTFKEFMNYADQLTCKIPPTTFIIENTKEVDKNLSFNENELLFTNNGDKYYGSCDKMFQSMCIFKEEQNEDSLNNKIKFDEEIKLNFKLSTFIIKQYIMSWYTHNFNIYCVECKDIMEFLKLIDGYPTVDITIKSLEHDIVEYFEKHVLEYNDYMKGLAVKYQLEGLYVSINNQKFNS
jgi:hypothetical protein